MNPAKEAGHMAAQTIEFSNSQGHPYRMALCRSSSKTQRVSAERSFDEADRANWQGTGAEIDQNICTQEHGPNGRESQRLTMETELSASIVHQLSQPLTSMLAHAQAAKRWLSGETPNLMEAVTSLDRIAKGCPHRRREYGANSVTLQTEVYRQEGSKRS